MFKMFVVDIIKLKSVNLYIFLEINRIQINIVQKIKKSKNNYKSKWLLFQTCGCAKNLWN